MQKIKKLKEQNWKLPYEAVPIIDDAVIIATAESIILWAVVLLKVMVFVLFIVFKRICRSRNLGFYLSNVKKCGEKIFESFQLKSNHAHTQNLFFSRKKKENNNSF
jgi:hypothetical protein